MTFIPICTSNTVTPPIIPVIETPNKFSDNVEEVQPSIKIEEDIL